MTGLGILQKTDSKIGFAFYTNDNQLAIIADCYCCGYEIVREAQKGDEEEFSSASEVDGVGVCHRHRNKRDHTIMAFISVGH